MEKDCSANFQTHRADHNAGGMLSPLTRITWVTLLRLAAVTMQRSMEAPFPSKPQRGCMYATRPEVKYDACN
eukprot:2531560-Amphidinium_carterae.1